MSKQEEIQIEDLVNVCVTMDQREVQLGREKVQGYSVVILIKKSTESDQEADGWAFHWPMESVEFFAKLFGRPFVRYGKTIVYAQPMEQVVTDQLKVWAETTQRQWRKCENLFKFLAEMENMKVKLEGSCSDQNTEPNKDDSFSV